MVEDSLQQTSSADTSLFIPIVKIMGDVFEDSKRVLHKPVEEIRDKMNDLYEADYLNFCIFVIVLVPVSIAYCLMSFAILFIEMLLFFIVVFCASILFILIGIWPAFIITVDVTCISIRRLPKNFYYHSAIIYNTVLLRGFVKVVSLMLIPIFHLLAPPVLFIIGLVVQLPVFAAYSFFGYPLQPWSKIQQYHDQAWLTFAEKVDTLYSNYGHASGIPENWEGTIYGLPVDPIAVVLSIFLYILTCIPVTIGVFSFCLYKVVHTFGGIFNSTSKHLQLYKAWLDIEEMSTSAIRKYALFATVEKFVTIIKGYSDLIKIIIPSNLDKILKSNNPFDSFDCQEINCSNCYLLIPILLSLLIRIIVLVIVLTMIPLTHALLFVIWIVLWPVVLILPTLAYIAGWLLIGLQILFTVLMYFLLILLAVSYTVCLSIIFSLPLALVSVSGPILALRIPFRILKAFYSNPVDMLANIKKPLEEIPKIIKTVDYYTYGSAWKNHQDNFKKIQEERKKIDYWNLFINRCVKESRDIQHKKWLLPEEVIGLSPNAINAIPGVAIVAILVDSIMKNKKEKSMIFWDERNICNNSNRDYTDNIASVFWPRIMKVKEAIMNIDECDLIRQTTWISAKLCDGEKEENTTEELKEVLKEFNEDNPGHKRRLLIKSMVEDIVISLSRLHAMKSNMEKIYKKM